MKKLFIMMFMGVALTSVAQNRCFRAVQCDSARACRQICPMSCRADSAMKLNLSEKDQKVYNELRASYEKEAQEIREKYGCEQRTKGVQLTEEQMDKNHRNRFAAKKAMAELKEVYYGKFRKILTPSQAARALNLKGNGCVRQGKALGCNGKGHGRHAKNFRGKGRGMNNGDPSCDRNRPCCNNCPVAAN